MTSDTQILAAVEGLLDGSEYEVVDVVCAGSSRGRLIRVFVDKPLGVTVEDCARLSRALGDHFDQSGLVVERYVLEVSSPGIDRPLRRDEDFERFAGEVVEVLTHEKIDGRHRHLGTLAGLDPERREILVHLEDGARVAIPTGAIKKANLKRNPWDPRRSSAPRGRE